MKRSTQPTEMDADGQRHWLVSAIVKMERLEKPGLGNRWRDGMLRYYYPLLAELTLRQQSGEAPTPELVGAMEIELRKQYSIMVKAVN
jgi:hypothetical protein